MADGKSKGILAASSVEGSQSNKEAGHSVCCGLLVSHGAADGTRTRNNQLGRLTLYQLNYRRMVGATGFEPATLCSLSRCATKLRYAPKCVV